MLRATAQLREPPLDLTIPAPDVATLAFAERQPKTDVATSGHRRAH
jgi:hypothetical protein